MNDGLAVRSKFIYFSASIVILLLYWKGDFNVISFDDLTFKNDFWKLAFWFSLFFALLFFTFSLLFILETVKSVDRNEATDKSKKYFKRSIILFALFSISFLTASVTKEMFNKKINNVSRSYGPRSNIRGGRNYR